jgi:hypothetical protein
MLQVEALAIAPKDKVEVWPALMGFGVAENAGDVGQTGAGGRGGVLTVKVTEHVTEPP